MVETSRRTVIALLALQALGGATSAQAQEKDSGRSNIEMLQQTVASFKFYRASDFDRVFMDIFGIRLRQSIADVDKSAESAVRALVEELRERLIAKYPNDNDFEVSVATQVLEATIFFQNILIATSTDLERGGVRVTEGIVERVKAKFCPLYTICGK